MLRSCTFIFCLLILAACQPAQQELNWRAPNAVEEKQARLDYQSEIQMADRSYIESVLLQTFNATGTPAAAYIQSDVYQRVEFGGACDVYAISDKNATTVEFPREQCFTGIGLVQPSNNNPMRYSLTTKVCERLVIDTDRMNVVKSKIYSDGKWKNPDSTSLRKAWSLFLQSGDLDQGSVDGLLELAKVSSGDEDAWKNIILTMCMSPEWQVL